MVAWSAARLALLCCLLAVARVPATPADPCDPEETAVAYLREPLLLPGCTAAFDDEDALLASSCLGDTATALAADGSAAACVAIRKQWWRGAQAIDTAQWLRSATERARVRSFAQAFRAGAADVVALVLRGGSAAQNAVVPAVQWAQNQTVVAVMVRYSPKKHGPVSVANVEEPEVAINSSHISFKGLGRPNSRAPLRFELDLELRDAIVPGA